MATKRLSLPPIPSTYQTRTLSELHNMHYYLTEGLEGAKHREYCDVHSFTRAINSQGSKLLSGNADESLSPYMVFSHVTQEELYKIEHVRDTHYKGLRFLYLNDPKVLIVKIMRSKIHEMLTREFGHAFIRKAQGMCLGRALADIGGATYQGTSGGKEADTAFQPRFTRNHETDWPTIVLEGGVSQSAPRLRADARWWLEQSMGQVNVVLLFSVSKLARTIHIEHWEAKMVPNPQVTQVCHHPLTITSKVGDTILINAHSTTGGPLELNFQKIFLRAPVAEHGETNFTFTALDLREYYEDIWSTFQ